MKCYLAGPMTGLPLFNYPMFELSAYKLRKRGMEIFSPHEIDHDEPGGLGSLPYKDYIRGGLKLLLECDAIIMMDGWELSKGCMTELYVANACGLKIFFFNPRTEVLTTNWVEGDEWTTKR